MQAHRVFGAKNLNMLVGDRERGLGYRFSISIECARNYAVSERMNIDEAYDAVVMHDRRVNMGHTHIVRKCELIS